MQQLQNPVTIKRIYELLELTGDANSFQIILDKDGQTEAVKMSIATLIDLVLNPHLSNFVHENIEHDNRLELNNVSGINTGDQVADGITITGSGTSLDPFVSVGGGGGASALDDLTDVEILNLQDGEVLMYNSTSQMWENNDNVVNKISDENISGIKTFVNGLVSDTTVKLKETTTPTAQTGYAQLYTQSDNELFFQDGDGVNHIMLADELTLDTLFIGNSTNRTEEILTSNMLVGTASLITGQYTLNNPAITINSIVLFSISTAGALAGTLKYTLSSGQCIFISTDNTDTVTFSYQIIL